MNRRRAIALLGTVGVTGVAGCVGGEDGSFEYAAAPAEIPAAEQAGYRAQGPEAIEIDETVEVAGLSRDVLIRTYSASYTDPENQTSLFLVSTPDVSFAGVSVNPLARLSGADLIARVVDEGLGRAGGDMALKEVQQEDEITLTVLDAERTVPIFSAVLEVEGSDSENLEAVQNGEIPVRLYLLSITHPKDTGENTGDDSENSEGDGESTEGDGADDGDASEDVLFALGLHPEPVDTGEEIQSFIEGIEHPVEVDSESVI